MNAPQTPAGPNGQGKPARTPGRPNLSAAHVPRLMVGLIVLVVLSGILFVNYRPQGYALSVGSVAPEDFLAPATAVDSYATAQARERAAAMIPDYFRFDSTLAPAATASLDQLQGDIAALLQNTTLSQDDLRAAIAARLPADGATEAARAIVALGRPAWINLMTKFREAVVAQLSVELPADELSDARATLATKVAGFNVSAALETSLIAIGNAKLQPTLVLDVEETTRRREAAMAAIEPTMILKDQIIARRGDVLDARQIALLQDFGVLRSSLSIWVIVGALALAAVMTAVITVYLFLHEHEVFMNGTRLLLVAIIVSLVLVATQLTRGISGFLAPVAAGTMLIASLLGARLALFVGPVLAAAVGLILGGDIRFGVAALVGGVVGVYGLAWVGQRSALTRAGFMVSLGNVLVVLAFAMVRGESLGALATWQAAGFAFLNGILSAVLTIGTLPFFESTFGILTDVRLLELANPNQPLLRRLLVEAPGTYHHSIVVGNLAEAAADTVGANRLLTRVGAYYHDIGKVTRPYFFIENQIGQENPHDKISPGLSALIITSHVKDGVTLAEEARLPAPIVNIIRSHHGRTLVSYFYRRATENGNIERVVEEDFRYDGPLPESPEEAIVMLADAMEAAVRSLPEPTPTRIENLVRRLIRERLSDGQLERCDLTLRDLDRIGETFVRVLMGIFHARIEYPKSPDDLIRQITASGIDAAQASPSVPEPVGDDAPQETR